IVSNFTLYHRWLETIAWLAGFGGILLIFAAIYHGRSRSRAFLALNLLAAIVGFMLVLSIDFLRPELANPGIFNDPAQFNAFTTAILATKVGMITLSCIGMIASAVSTRRVTEAEYIKNLLKPSRE
nr:hypothetical protein [Candidatus Sigynarchaeota archaeon]